MMELDQLAGLVALTDIEGIGDSRAYELFQAFDSISELSSQPMSAFSEFHYVDSQTHAELQTLDSKQGTHLEAFEAYLDDGIVPIGIEDGRYPEALRSQHAPLVLYASGETDRLTDSLVSVSGSRETNSVGCKWIKELSSELARAGRTVVSGGALGADTAAHRGALDATGATIVVLGTGLNVAYPPENAELFAEIVDAGGLVISHRPPPAEPNRHAFIDRNKTISALSPGLIVVATDGSGGTQAQYEIAQKQGRHVFVPPHETDITPAEGIDEIRADSSTSTIRSSGALIDDLETLEADLSSDNPKEDADVDSTQTQFGEWS
ncbi:DNA-processing protein DprA [Halohasta salina]|uniref:DNA-processing protein DprA n=1 Tax=Halohasta salina TaxID=2961621 RepID=UPI0020A3ECA7|nr:DNA-processing protein DprA [Halohasta salina]